jgi:hypothetical protein
VTKLNTSRMFLGGMLLALILSVGFFAGAKRGIPFVTQREQWTIGIYRGKTPFSFDSPLNIINPILKAEHVTDVQAKFVADPFLLKEGQTWYLFFEVYNKATDQGDLAVATSTNTWIWKYQQVILDEPFHLSYPYVFKWGDDFFLIPESFEANSIRLYKADVFPSQWSFVTTLVEGGEYVDNSIVHYRDTWWLFAGGIGNDSLHLFYADDLMGPWIKHPASPIVEQNKHKSRPSGRVLVYQDRLYRYTMDIDPPYGTHQVLAFEITDLTRSAYSEVQLKEEAIIKAGGSGWRRDAMHQIDPVQIRPDYWISAVDGFGEYLLFGWDY